MRQCLEGLRTILIGSYDRLGLNIGTVPYESESGMVIMMELFIMEWFHRKLRPPRPQYGYGLGTAGLYLGAQCVGDQT